jgi:cysteine desulfurase family protein (TIGR01976 family)
MGRLQVFRQLLPDPEMSLLMTTRDMPQLAPEYLSIATPSETDTFDSNWVRSQFPSLSQTVHGQPAVFLDGPGGTQVPQRVIDAISDYLRGSNANTGGAFATSQRTDAMIAGARAAMADFLACDSDEVVFGANMTSLTFAVSRSIARELKPGDEIVVTRLDHGANFSPWVALEERGVTIRIAEIHDEDCTLDMEDLARKITNRTKLVAVGYASNAVGTINDVREVVRLAHGVGAMAYIDAVHYAPHGPIDVRALDCDFLVCSSYKFFGPHMGVLYGKQEHLRRLQPYKLAVNTNAIPYCWEWGTLNHECIAGITACVDYLADLGRRIDPSLTHRRAALLAAWKAIQKHERLMVERLIAGLLEIPGLKLYGMSDPARFGDRCPTVAVRIAGHTPLALATELGRRGFFTWDGNYYALNLTQHLDVEKDGGFLRIGLAHYNTAGEVDQFLAALREMTK